MRKYCEDNVAQDPELTHKDYFLKHGSGWFHTGKFQIRVIAHDETCFLEVFDRDGNSLKELTVNEK
jgi:hypothetical protein